MSNLVIVSHRRHDIVQMTSQESFAIWYDWLECGARPIRVVNIEPDSIGLCRIMPGNSWPQIVVFVRFERDVRSFTHRSLGDLRPNRRAEVIVEEICVAIQAGEIGPEGLQ